MKHVELFGFAGSTYVRTARMVCEEKHVDYQLKPLEFRQESHRTLHPFLRMPIMRVGNIILYETAAITTYLDESFDGPRLTPNEPLARAQMLQWISACNDYLYRDLVEALLEPGDSSDEVLATARQHLQIVDKQLRDNLFLLGGEIYLCDLFLAPMIAFAQSKLEPTLLHGLDSLSAWRERMESRESFSVTKS